MVKKMNNTGEALIIYYDGNCQLCLAEMIHLKKHDKKNQIKLINLHDDDFAANFPHVNFAKAMNILHGEYQNKTLLGLEVTHRAWTLVGKGFWVAPLNWPLFKQIAHGVYLLMAKYRHIISPFLAKKFGIKNQTCDLGNCYAKTTYRRNRR